MGKWSKTIPALADDSIKYDGTFSNNTAYQYMGNDGDVNNSAWRFLNVPIPRGATILRAQLRLCAGLNDANVTCNVKIDAERAANATQIASAADWNSRVRTNTKVNWNAVAAWTTATWYTSPDFAKVIEEVIALPNWKQNMAIQVFANDNSSSANAIRRSYCYETNGGLLDRCAYIDIVWALSMKLKPREQDARQRLHFRRTATQI